jgi:hypothetical protein
VRGKLLLERSHRIGMVQILVGAPGLDLIDAQA